MRSKLLSPNLGLLLFVFFMIGCSNATSTPSPNDMPTNTPTIMATNTPFDISTAPPVDMPTNTPTDTSTNIPTSTATQTSTPKIRFPAQSDWVDYGTILSAGSQGEWDYYLWGGFAFSVIQKDENYYLYYQGSSDYRTGDDETVLWRAIGVATSQDGIHFTKYDNNPILTWFPNEYGEEGAVSSGVTLGEQGETVLYYGANTQEGPSTINANARIASSLDGINFTDMGVVLRHDDPSVWGSGDELFPVDAIYDQGHWIVYYIPNGTSQSGNLGVAYGNQFNALSQSSAVMSNSQPVSVWGTAGHVQLEQNSYALILNNVRDKLTEVRMVSIQSPDILGEPVATYQFEEVQQAILLLDREREIWFMYYRTFENSYGVKLAPAGNLSLPPLTTP